MRWKSAPPVATALLLLLLLAAARALVSSGGGRVLVAGRAMPACAFRQYTGIPCPHCGFTRSVALALHGDWLSSMAANPAGLAAVLGTAAAAVGLVAFAAGIPLGRRTRVTAAAACVVAVTVWLAHWVCELAHL